jgi:hypothetical protein
MFGLNLHRDLDPDPRGLEADDLHVVGHVLPVRMVIALAFFKRIFLRSLPMNQAHSLIIEVTEPVAPARTRRWWGSVPGVRLQLVLGNDRAEVSLNNLERLENRPLREELGVILRTLTVVAATRILGRKMTDVTPTPAAGCCGSGVDGRCHLVVAAVAHVAKAVEMSVLRLDEPEPRVPKRVGPVQGLEQRVNLTRAVCSDSRLLTKTLDSVHITANKPGTGCSTEPKHLSRRRSFWTRPGP